MRAALGGEAALDAIKSFTVGGGVRETAGGFTKGLPIDLSVPTGSVATEPRHCRPAGA
jgi:hypothetical protein